LETPHFISTEGDLCNVPWKYLFSLLFLALSALWDHQKGKSTSGALEH